jgi:pimeloyl-ACP methyl ester carboxylesterase
MNGIEMNFPTTEHTFKTKRHTTFYLASGDQQGPLVIFVHGWPELSISWRHQLRCFASLGFRAIAPDMRGYGRSSIYSRYDDYAVEHAVEDMIELIDSLGHEKAIWVGHDWGSPVVWSLASHHPKRCSGVVSLCVPYHPAGLAPQNLIPLVDRAVYPADVYPAGQWEYMLFYQENFAEAQRQLEANVSFTVKVLMRGGDPAGQGKPARTAEVRRNGGWFPGATATADIPRDALLLTEEDLHSYASSLERNGFFGPNAWYMNADRNVAYASRAENSGKIDIPVLFLHAAFDYVLATTSTRLVDPMRQACSNLAEFVIPSGHWMSQEKPALVNATITRWIAAQLPNVWPSGKPFPVKSY